LTIPDVVLDFKNIKCPCDEPYVTSVGGNDGSIPA